MLKQLKDKLENKQALDRGEALWLFTEADLISLGH